MIMFTITGKHKKQMQFNTAPIQSSKAQIQKCNSTIIWKIKVYKNKDKICTGPS